MAFSDGGGSKESSISSPQTAKGIMGDSKEGSISSPQKAKQTMGERSAVRDHIKVRISNAVNSLLVREVSKTDSRELRGTTSIFKPLQNPPDDSGAKKTEHRELREVVLRQMLSKLRAAKAKEDENARSRELVKGAQEMRILLIALNCISPKPYFVV